MTHGTLLLMPGIGTELVLSSNWTTRLPPKDMNALMAAMAGAPFQSRGTWKWTLENVTNALKGGRPILLPKGANEDVVVTIPAKTRLKVIGIYITKTTKVDMLTFQVMDWPGPRWPEGVDLTIRSPLYDCNQMMVSFVAPTTPGTRPEDPDVLTSGGHRF